MEHQKRNPIVNWIIKSKALGILFFVIIGAICSIKVRPVAD